MFNGDISDPGPYTGRILDKYLEQGYFRLGQTLFTTTGYYDPELQKAFDCFWLRVDLEMLGDVRSHKVYKRNRHFDVQISDVVYSNEIDDLYESYRLSVDFSAAESVSGFLDDAGISKQFNSKTILVREGNKLIAVAYFDVGKIALMGNMNFYHPDYKKYSLGKFLMLLKIEYAKLNNMKFYYTGYIALEYDKFDYKIFPDIEAMEVLIPQIDQEWHTYEFYKKEGLKDVAGFWSHINQDGMRDLNDGSSEPA